MRSVKTALLALSMIGAVGMASTAVADGGWSESDGGSRYFTQMRPMVGPDTQLVARRTRHPESGARLHHQGACRIRGQPVIGSMNEATSTLIRAVSMTMSPTKVRSTCSAVQAPDPLLRKNRIWAHVFCTLSLAAPQERRTGITVCVQY